MLSISQSRERRRAHRAYKAQLLADNLELLAAYAECLDMTREALLQSMRQSERDLTEEEFGDYLSDHAERLSA